MIKFFQNVDTLLLGYGKDTQNDGKKDVLTDEFLIVQMSEACSQKYNRILLFPDDKYYDAVKGSLPSNFAEDCLICAHVPGKSSGSCRGDSGKKIESFLLNIQMTCENAVFCRLKQSQCYCSY